MPRGFLDNVPGSSFQEYQEAGNDVSGQEGTEMDMRRPLKSARDHGASDWVDWLWGKGEQKRGRATTGWIVGPSLPWGNVSRKRTGEDDQGFGVWTC